MLPVLVLYATREGQSRRIAEHAAARLRRKALPVDVLNVAEVPPDFALERYAGALLVAPVHIGKHPREMLAFIRSQRAALARLPLRFFSVSLSQAGVEDEQAGDAQRKKAARDVAYLTSALCTETGLPARSIAPVAGALAYTQYSFFKRMIMKYIARQSGGSTDTTRDHVYTDYAALDVLVDEFVAQLPLPAQPTQSA